MRKIVEKSMLGKAWAVSDDYNLNSDLNDTKNLVKNILASRGIIGDEDVQRFLNPSIKEYMPDPSVLKDMDVATSVIADAICDGAKIAIYGDDDVDGITSTAIFVKYLRSIGVDVSWHLQQEHHYKDLCTGLQMSYWARIMVRKTRKPRKKLKEEKKQILPIC